MLSPFGRSAAIIASASVSIFIAVAPAAARAQTGAPPATQDSAARHTAIFGDRDAITAAAFVLGTVAMLPLDRHIAEQSQRPGIQGNAAFDHTLTAIRELGEPGSIVLAGATYIYGRSDDSPASAELGLRTIESIGAAGVTYYIIKGFVGRARPFVTSDTNSHQFKPGRGFSQDDYM